MARLTVYDQQKGWTTIADKARIIVTSDGARIRVVADSHAWTVTVELEPQELLNLLRPVGFVRSVPIVHEIKS